MGVPLAIFFNSHTQKLGWFFFGFIVGSLFFRFMNNRVVFEWICDYQRSHNTCQKYKNKAANESAKNKFELFKIYENLFISWNIEKIQRKESVEWTRIWLRTKLCCTKVKGKCNGVYRKIAHWWKWLAVIFSCCKFSNKD